MVRWVKNSHFNKLSALNCGNSLAISPVRCKLIKFLAQLELNLRAFKTRESLCKN